MWHGSPASKVQIVIVLCLGRLAASLRGSVLRPQCYCVHSVGQSSSWNCDVMLHSWLLCIPGSPCGPGVCAGRVFVPCAPFAAVRRCCLPRRSCTEPRGGSRVELDRRHVEGGRAASFALVQVSAHSDTRAPSYGPGHTGCTRCHRWCSSSWIGVPRCHIILPPHRVSPHCCLWLCGL